MIKCFILFCKLYELIFKYSNTDMTISEVLEANPDKFSMYVEILQKTEF